MKLSDKLDYDLESVEDRLNLVNEIISENDSYLVDYNDNHYNPHINQNNMLNENTKVGKDLESLASYLLYAKDSNATEDTVTDYRQKRNNNREASIENLLKVKEDKRETNRSIMKVSKIKVTKKDRDAYRELRESGLSIERLTKMINEGVDSKGNKLSIPEIKKLKWVRTDIQKDEVAVKNELKGYIRFQNIMGTEKDHSALSHIQFDNAEIIRILIEDYSELVEYSYDDTFGYLKIIMMVLEDLIEETGFKDYLKDILTWKIDKISYDEMINLLKEKYDIKLTKPRLSKITRETIPNMIVETYKQQREDYVYTFVFQGDYKACNSCKENYLATTKYFSPHKRSKAGLRPICKKCRKSKYNNKAVTKNV